MKNKVILKLFSLFLVFPLLCGCLALGGKTTYYSNPPELEDRRGNIEQRMGNLERICGVAPEWRQGDGTAGTQQHHEEISARHPGYAR